MAMQNFSKIKYQIVSIGLFAVFFISLLFPWYYVPGLKTRPGTLILSSLFPLGVLAVAAFIIINIVTIAKASKLYLHVINLIPPIVLLILSIRMYLYLDEGIGIAFYISITSLVLSFVFYLINLAAKTKEITAKKKPNSQQKSDMTL